MLSLTEAITHCEEKAKELREQVNTHIVVDAEEIGDCIECAEEHEQLAAWLKELKALREGKSQGEWIEKVETKQLGHGWLTAHEIVCSVCGKEAEWLDGGSQFLSKFCPNCGARIGGVKNESR